VESSRPLCELKKAVVTDMHVTIACNVAGLIEDGAVLQTGIGGFPMQFCPFSWTVKISGFTANWFPMV